MQDFKSLAGERFSARKFTAEPVSKEDLEYIMEVRTTGSFSMQPPALEMAHRTFGTSNEKIAGMLQQRVVQDGSYVYRRYEEHRGQLGAKVRQQTSW